MAMRFGREYLITVYLSNVYLVLYTRCYALHTIPCILCNPCRSGGVKAMHNPKTLAWPC